MLFSIIIIVSDYWIICLLSSPWPLTENWAFPKSTWSRGWFPPPITVLCVGYNHLKWDPPSLDQATHKFSSKESELGLRDLSNFFTIGWLLTMFEDFGNPHLYHVNEWNRRRPWQRCMHEADSQRMSFAKTFHSRWVFEITQSICFFSKCFILKINKCILKMCKCNTKGFCDIKKYHRLMSAKYH